MQLTDFEKRFTTIFLADKIYPTKLVLLKRGADMKFAPNKLTGMGGKIGDKEEFKDETPLESAIRELHEESGLVGIPLKEFGRLIVNGNKRVVHYFYGITDQDKLPQCPEGTLEWVPFKMILSKDIIPTTKLFLEEWLAGFGNWDPFTLFVELEDSDNPESDLKEYQFKEGLHYKF